jgi:micrococcal nuclease
MLVVVALLILVGPACVPAEPSVAGPATVARVVDGDTIDVDLGGTSEHVRLIGIDTPETSDPRRPVECFGAEASARTAELLPEGTEVVLERDVEARDRYDRLLAYVYRRDDGLFVNLALARDGFAVAATYPPNVAHRDELVAAAAEAREAGRGLWERCGGPDVPAP